jgi:putative peptide zinc metalloprotease protein
MEDLWLPRGTSLGVVADPDEYEIVAAVRQTDADRLFGSQTKSAEVKLTGQSDATVEAAQWEISPGGRRQLPSIRLGSRGGGEIPVRADDQKGRQAAEPFYLVRAALPNDGDLVLKHGQIGAIRFHTGWEPLLPRWVRQFRQFLQERYRL